MPEIPVDLKQFIPPLSTFYQWFLVFEEKHYIQKVDLVNRNGTDFLQVYRNP